MILNSLRLTFLFIITLILPTVLFGQESESKYPYFWYDQMVESSKLGAFNGVEYVENYRVLNEKHKFFDHPNFSVGSIVYEGHPYFNLALKYDLFEDRLLLKSLNQTNAPTMVLDKHKVSRFEINGHQFINIQLKIKDSLEPFGFLEVLLANDSIALYKKNKKGIRTKTSDKTRYYEFKEDNAYYTYYDNTFVKIKKGTDLVSIFPIYKPQLKTIEKQYRSIQKENFEAYLISVLGDLFNILVQTHPIEQ